MPRVRVQGLMLLPLFLGAACGSSTAPTATVVGTYHVVTVNGAAPPALISQNSQRSISLAGATFRIGADGRFTLDDTINVVVVGQGTVPQTEHRTGSYVVAGSKVTFTPDQAGLLSVTSLDWAGESLTLTDLAGSVPVVIVFRRRTDEPL